MATQKTLPTAQAADDFIDKIEDETTRKDCQYIMGLMQDISKEKATMWGPSIIGFGNYHYKYESGHQGDSCIIGFSPRKENITLYISAGLPALQSHLAKLGKHKVKGGCLHLKKLADVDGSVLKELIGTAYSILKSKHSRPEEL